MAEEGGIGGGALGGAEAEAAEADAAAGLDPIAAALATSAVETGRPLDPKLADYLDKQQKLVEIQTEHLHEQRELQLEHLRVRRWKDRLSLTLQALGVSLGVAVFIALAALVWQAHEDHGLVIQRFTAPPSFVARGVSGDTIAADVMGKLSSIVGYVRENSFSSTGGVSTDTSNEVKIEIPETGVSLTEAWRLLREELGSAKKVSGALRDEGDGRVTLTARLDGGESFSATGPASDLGALEQSVAEQLYGATDPNNLAIYLIGAGRKADAFAAAARYAAAPLDPIDRANAVTMWGDLSEDPAREARFGRIALRTDPGLRAAHYDIADGDLKLQHAEEALSEARLMLTLRPEDQPRQHRGAGSSEMLGFALSTIDDLTGDYGSAAVHRGQFHQHAPERPVLLLDRAIYAALRHDPQTGRDLIGEAPVYGAVDPALDHVARYDADVALEDWRGALDEVKALAASDEAALAASKDADGAAGLRVDLDRRDRPMLAVALARTGDAAGAAALVSATPLDCYACLRARGSVAASAGKAAEAERWFGEAIRQAPDVPLAYVDRGRSRLVRAEVAGALADAQAAARLGPRFADALALWGHALARQGRGAEAVAKYDAALAQAPAWTTVRRARAAAARHLR